MVQLVDIRKKFACIFLEMIIWTETKIVNRLCYNECVGMKCSILTKKILVTKLKISFYLESLFAWF